MFFKTKVNIPEEKDWLKTVPATVCYSSIFATVQYSNQDIRDKTYHAIYNELYIYIKTILSKTLTCILNSKTNLSDATPLSEAWDDFCVVFGVAKYSYLLMYKTKS